ncbi:hypothetical protein Ddye_014457, partial [Dipteronia dyeriana]
MYSLFYPIVPSFLQDPTETWCQIVRILVFTLHFKQTFNWQTMVFDLQDFMIDVTYQTGSCNNYKRKLSLKPGCIPKKDFKSCDTDMFFRFTFGGDGTLKGELAIFEEIRSVASKSQWLEFVRPLIIHSRFIAMYATVASRNVDCCLVPESQFYLKGPGGHMAIVIAVQWNTLQKGKRWYKSEIY